MANQGYTPSKAKPNQVLKLGWPPSTKSLVNLRIPKFHAILEQSRDTLTVILNFSENELRFPSCYYNSIAHTFDIRLLP